MSPSRAFVEPAYMAYNVMMGVRRGPKLNDQSGLR